MPRLVALALLLCAAAVAQQTSATLTGSVTDATGAIVPSVVVRVTSLSTNVVREAQTD
jgi:hypothetical protein